MFSRKPGARPGEHRLDQDRAAEQVAELQAHHGERGRRGVLHHVEEDAASRSPLARSAGDEFLAQDLADQRAHRARDDAHRDHRHRDGRQDQVRICSQSQPQRPSRRARAHRRQPAELDREDDHQHHAEPVMRHRDAGDRDRGGDLVDRRCRGSSRRGSRRTGRARSRSASPAIASISVLPTAASTSARPTGRSRSRCRDRLQRAPQPQPELHRQRAVEAVGLAHLLGEVLRGIRRQHRDQRIAGRDVHQHEADQRHAEHDRDRVDDRLAM